MLRALARGRGAARALPAPPSLAFDRLAAPSTASIAAVDGRARAAAAWVAPAATRAAAPTTTLALLPSASACGAARSGERLRLASSPLSGSWSLGCGWRPAAAPGGARAFGIKRVRQRRRSRGRIIQPKQHHYEPKPDGYRPLPLSLLGSGPIRRVLTMGTVEARRLAATVDWERYKSDVQGVRWHPVGGWRVQFDRRDYEHNFFVKCDCYFRVAIYGFDQAKQLAIGYRKRLEAEWEEQQRIWYQLDSEREARRLEKRAARQRYALEAQGHGDDALAGGKASEAHSLWGLPPPPSGGDR